MSYLFIVEEAPITVKHSRRLNKEQIKKQFLTTILIKKS